MTARGWSEKRFITAVARARYRLGLSAEDVAECASVVYLALEERFSGSTPPAATTEDDFLRYTYRAARNEYHAAFRRRRGRNVPHPLDDGDGRGEVGSDAYRRQHLNRQALDPDWLRPDIPGKLRDQVLGLLPDGPPPPSHRRVVELMAGGARTQAEVAKLAGTSTATVSRRVAEAMEYVQELVRTGVIRLPDDDDHGGVL